MWTLAGRSNRARFQRRARRHQPLIIADVKNGFEDREEWICTRALANMREGQCRRRPSTPVRTWVRGPPRHRAENLRSTPPWPNGQGVGLLIQRVRVPLGVLRRWRAVVANFCDYAGRCRPAPIHLARIELATFSV